jgi:hypothetical protein
MVAPAPTWCSPAKAHIDPAVQALSADAAGRAFTLECACLAVNGKPCRHLAVLVTVHGAVTALADLLHVVALPPIAMTGRRAPDEAS